MPWFCARTLPRQEPIAQYAVSALGHPTLLPKIWTEPRQRLRAPWRSERQLTPMFPSYLIISFDLQDPEWPHILRQRGVVRILSSEPGNPLPIPDTEIERLIELSELLQELPVTTPIPVGSRVRIIGESPLIGLEGICAWSDADRVRLLMEMLGGQRHVNVARELVEML